MKMICFPSTPKLPIRLAVIACLLSVQTFSANYYWVGGSGNWSDYANHWATTSGGSIFHTTIPTFGDDVFFDANSFTADSQMVTLDNTFIYCRNMDWTGITYAAGMESIGSAGSNPINIYGSLFLNPAIFEFSCVLQFAGGMTGAVIQTAGIAIEGYVLINGTGTWELVSDLACTSLNVTSGTFNSNNYGITAPGIGVTSANQPTLNLGTSTIHCSTLQINQNPNVNGAGCNLYFDVPFGSTNTLSCANNTFRNIYFYGPENEIWGSVTADSVFFYGEAEIKTLGFADNSLNCDYLYCGDDAVINTSANLTSLVGRAVFAQRATFQGKMTFDTLVFDNSGNFIGLFGTLAVNDTLIATGSCSAFTTLSGSALTPGVITKSSGQVSLEYFRLENITASGGATFVANNSFDLGGNTGWQFNTPATRDLYWVNGQGNWSDAAHWSLSSGGPGGNCPPSASDHVFLDDNSFATGSDTLFIDQEMVHCNNLTLQAPSFTPVVVSPSGYFNWYTQVQVNGSLLLLTGLDPLVRFSLTSANTGNIIRTGVSRPYLYVDGSGEWSLTENIDCLSLNFVTGTFNTNDFNISTDLLFCYYSYPKAVVNLGASTIYCGRFYTTAIDTNLHSSSANIVFDPALSGSAWSYMEVNSQSFHDIHFVNDGKIQGAFTCNNLVFDQQDSIVSANANIQKLVLGSDSYTQGVVTADSILHTTPGKAFGLGSFATINIGSAFETGGVSCDLLTRITSAGTATLNKTSGSVDLDYLYLENIHATGGAAFNATNTIDAGGNTGWNISSPAPRDVYWVGGSGNWSDQAHWALASGGAGGNCIPTIHDHVFFDDNSFSPTGTETVTIDLADVSCLDFNYSVSYPNKMININNNDNFNIYGSLNLTTQAQFSGFASYHNQFFLRSDSASNTLRTSDTYLHNLHVAGTGGYTLLDSLSCFALVFDDGLFTASGNPLNCKKMVVSSGLPSVDFGTTTLYCDSLRCDLAGPGFNSQNLSVRFTTTPGGKKLTANNQSFLNVTGGSLAAYGGFSCVNGLFSGFSFAVQDTTQKLQIGRAEFTGSVSINYGYASVAGGYILSFDTLVLNSSGTLIQVRDGATLRINDTLIVNNSPGFPTELKVYAPLTGDHFFIEKPAGVLCMDNMIMAGVHTAGPGMYFAGANSVNLSNNAGWIYASCNPNNSDVWPGDANYDLTVDNFDVLHVGLAYGAGGPARIGASNAWLPQPATDWPFQFANGTNLKNADCDGNGTIDNLDTTAVSLNYGLSHPPRLTSPIVASLPPVQLFVVANPDTVAEGDTVQVEVHLGTSVAPVDSIYGIAFTLLFDSAMVDTSYAMPFDYSSGWMGIQGANLLTFEKRFSAQGRVDIALTRTDHLNVSGDGIILTTGVVIVDNIGARLSSAPPYVTLPVTIANTRAVTAAEYYLSVNAQDGSVEIDTLGTVSLPGDPGNDSGFLLFPNPARGSARLIARGNPALSATLFNQFGERVRYFPGGTSEMKLDLDGLPASVYTLHIETSTGIQARKLVIAGNQGASGE